MGKYHRGNWIELCWQSDEREYQNRIIKMGLVLPGYRTLDWNVQIVVRWGLDWLLHPIHEWKNRTTTRSGLWTWLVQRAKSMRPNTANKSKRCIIKKEHHFEQKYQPEKFFSLISDWYSTGSIMILIISMMELVNELDSYSTCNLERTAARMTPIHSKGQDSKEIGHLKRKISKNQQVADRCTSKCLTYFRYGN